MGSNEAPNGHIQTGSHSRFQKRWRVVGAGLSNVWRFGDLELPAASGRLLLRGPNGTGKTTALEALAPYLLDLNPARMSAGKARMTNLSTLMREGAAGKRRCGYVWLTLAGPEDGTWSFGVRIQYSEGASPPVRVLPFAVPGRPLHDLKLYGAARAPLTSEQFEDAVSSCGGQIFEPEEAYVSHLAARLFGTPDREAVATLATRLRQVRNPALLSDLSSQAAAEALRDSLPGVAEDVINATAEALAESDATREAFDRDKEAAALLRDFREVWCGHATEVVANALASAVETAREVRAHASTVKNRTTDLATAAAEAAQAKQHAEELDRQIATAKSEIEALEKHQTYRDAGRLGDLKSLAAAQQGAADSAAQAMQATARGVAAECESLRLELGNVVEDLEDYRTQARSADPKADDSTRLLTCTVRPRAPLRAGEVVADAGAELVIHGDSARLRGAASAWLELAQMHSRQAGAAALAIIDHKDVELLQTQAEEKAKAARDAAARADIESAKVKAADMAAQEAVREIVSAVHSWTRTYPQMTEPLKPSASAEAAGGWRGSPWSVEDVEQLVEAEPGQVIATCDAWARHALARAESIIGELRVRAQRAAAEAAAVRDEAQVLREEAKDLRSGRLLPLPRPDWAGPGDDSVALGTALEWPDCVGDPRERALLEAAMAAAGLLGASLGDDGASTQCWRVEPTGPIPAQNLLELVAVDAAHPLASAASAVLARVQVASTAVVEADSDVLSALCIGRDGTFRAGVLRGRVSGVDDEVLLPLPSHIGARQRRAAALARAEALDHEATQLEVQATNHEDTAARLELEADAVSVFENSFPPREDLRAAESRRAEISRIARELRDGATAAATESERVGRELHRARTEWLERTRNSGLPGDLEQLVRLRDQGTVIADALRKAAEPVSGKLADRVDSVFARYSAEDIVQRLGRSEAEAQEAVRIATDTQTAVRVLEETAGAAIAEILARHEKVSKRCSSLEGDCGPARDRQVQTAKVQAAADVNLAEAKRKLREEAEPKAAQRLIALRALLVVPGVADAVLDGDTPLDDKSILEQVEAKLQGRRKLTMKTMLERADAAKAKLGGVWSLDHGDNHGDLLTFTLTYRDATYTPIEAAVHAEKLKTRAEQALAASDERALREFVIGRLPNAIGTAWHALQDWNIEVNRKMRSATASSGVGVQVRIPLRDDLAPASRDVYELSCNVSGAERTPEQRKRLGEALHALLAAAEGETMQQRVASAVDIRDWVQVHYEVTRPGGKTQRWSSRTGLSGGERRLVVLAPMLAAIASGYDQFGPKALRLVALDEVPAEVDERGREGLARYIAELDLDLICTSYMWDGCPGAWDGIDAHDLEAAPDETVVAFPMLVRSLSPIPEDAMSQLSIHGVE